MASNDPAICRYMKQRVLVFIVAYNAQTTINDVVSRIPHALGEKYDVEVLIIDDASKDATFEVGQRLSQTQTGPFRLSVLFNPINQGYGGNQKLGYHYAIENGFDFVALLHGDGQYAPECLPDLLEPLGKGEADAVFGSRMLAPRAALQGGMPVYKYVGNKILTWIENRLLRAHLSEFHSGYRIYSTRALARLPFDCNTNDFHFDTEIIIQLLTAALRIVELPIPTYYGDEICHVNGLKYAFDVVSAAIKARLQGAGLLYERKFDCGDPNSLPYEPKLDYVSPHSLAFARICEGAAVLDLGCAGGYMGAALQNKHCVVVGVDAFPLERHQLQEFYLHDLNQGPPPKLDYRRFDYILMLDVLEHLSEPERFLERLRQALSLNLSCQVIVSTGNIAYFITRTMLMLGQFNYGKRGLLDLTHTRLFTFSSFRRSLVQSGFTVSETRGVPGPFPLALGNNSISLALLKMNQLLIHLSRGLFSYQMFMVVKATPTLETLLKDAQKQSAERAQGVALA
jgi:glycosyltransferase involved in cell wall biosynthesis